LSDAASRYIDEMRARNWSEGTIAQYTKCFAEFAAFVAKNHEAAQSIRDITPEIIAAYQLWLCKRQSRFGGTLSVATQRAFLVALRSLFAWCAEERIVMLDPTRNLELPKVGRRLPRGVLSPKEMRQLLRQPDLGTWAGLRDRAILETFYSAGIRNSELRHLRACDIDLDRGYLTVIQGKYKKDRVVPLGKVAAHFIREYLTKARPHMLRGADTPETALFLSIHGRALGCSTLEAIFQKYTKLANLGKRVHPHALRHTCATAMLRGRADIRYIQQMLGHESLSSTEIYTHVEMSDLKAVHARSHPREVELPADPEWD
jgi:integrase/recombinase XerD